MLANVYFFVIPSVGGMAPPGINYKALILYVQSGYYLGVSGCFRWLLHPSCSLLWYDYVWAPSPMMERIIAAFLRSSAALSCASQVAFFFYYIKRRKWWWAYKKPIGVGGLSTWWLESKSKSYIIIRINNKVYLMDWIIGQTTGNNFFFIYFVELPTRKFSFLFISFFQIIIHIWNHSYTSSDANERNWPNSRSIWEWTIAAIWLEYILFSSWTFRRWDRVSQPNRKIRRKKENGVQWTLYTRSLH